LASQNALRRLVMVLASTLPTCESSEMPLKLLQFDRSPFLYSTLMVASFHSCGISPPFHTSTKMARRRSRTIGSSSPSILSSSATRRSGPAAFQFPNPFVAASTSSGPGTAARRRVARVVGRCATCSTTSGLSVGDLEFRRVSKNLRHRLRMVSLLRRSTPFSSVTNCCPPACLPPRPIDLLRYWYNPRMSRS